MGVMTFLFSLAMRRHRNRFLSDITSPKLAQARQLSDIINANRLSDFGREHNFDMIDNPDDFRKAVPIRSYDDFTPYVEKMKNGEQNVLVSQTLEMFATTSGTTSEPKFCPVTRRFTLEHHMQHKLWMLHLSQSHPGLLNGKFFTIVSPAEEGRTQSGIPYGSSSGRQYQNQAIPIRRRHAVPYEVCLIKDYESRYHAQLLFALGENISIATSVNPSTLVLLAQTMNNHAEALLVDLERGNLDNAPIINPQLRKQLQRHLSPKPQRAKILREIYKSNGALLPRDAWPELQLIVTWQGGSAPFYLSQLNDLWPKTPQRCLGLRASEGNFSIPLRDHTPEGVLAIGGHFLEFIPENLPVSPQAETLLAHELQKGERYRLVITTSGGFYRYDLADIIEVTGFHKNTPKVSFLHKAGNALSITGEKVTEDQVVGVMQNIEQKFPEVAGFTVTQELLTPPRYVLAVELKEDAYNNRKTSEKSSELLRNILHAFEDSLRSANDEYSAKRESMRLGEPKLLLLAPGSYAKHRRILAEDGKPDGQIKPPHLIKPAGEGKIPVKGCPFFDRVEILRVL